MDTKATFNQRQRPDGKKLLKLFQLGVERVLAYNEYNRRNLGRLCNFLRLLSKSQLLNYKREAMQCKAIIMGQNKSMSRKMRVLIFNHIQSLTDLSEKNLGSLEVLMENIRRIQDEQNSPRSNGSSVNYKFKK